MLITETNEVDEAVEVMRNLENLPPPQVQQRRLVLKLRLLENKWQKQQDEYIT